MADSVADEDGDLNPDTFVEAAHDPNAHLKVVKRGGARAALLKGKGRKRTKSKAARSSPLPPASCAGIAPLAEAASPRSDTYASADVDATPAAATPITEEVKEVPSPPRALQRPSTSCQNTFSDDGSEEREKVEKATARSSPSRSRAQSGRPSPKGRSSSSAATSAHMHAASSVTSGARAALLRKKKRGPRSKTLGSIGGGARRSPGRTSASALGAKKMSVGKSMLAAATQSTGMGSRQKGGDDERYDGDAEPAGSLCGGHDIEDGDVIALVEMSKQLYVTLLNVWRLRCATRLEASDPLTHSRTHTQVLGRRG